MRRPPSREKEHAWLLDVGIQRVYRSSTPHLHSRWPVVEVFVHLDAIEAPDYVSIAADLPIDAENIENEKHALLLKLPRDWREVGHPLLRKIGADGIESGRSLALPVPSAAVDGEWNILVNPLHADFSAIRFEQPRTFEFDSRMFKVGKT